MTQEEKILISKINDIIRLSDKYSSPRFSSFLDEGEQAFIRRELILSKEMTFFGGYPDAQRRIFGVFPEWMEQDDDLFPIKVLKFAKNGSQALTHRHYLGTILSLGIDRNKTGDILVGDDGADVFVAADIAEYICDNVKKVAGCGVSVKTLENCEQISYEQQFEEINAVAASARLDALIAATLNISRSNALTLVRAGKVSVNHIAAQDPSKALSIGDILSLRGYGRYVLAEIGAKTRSDRIHIRIKKYI